MTKGDFKKLKKESWIEEKAEKFLEDEKGCLVAKQVAIGSKDVFLPGQERKIDLVGITERGKIYLCECEAGIVRRPIQGLGQLLFYKALVRKSSLDFMGKLKSRLEKDGKLEQYEQYLKDIDLKKVRYYPFISPEEKAKYKKVKDVFNSIEREYGIRMV